MAELDQKSRRRISGVTSISKLKWVRKKRAEFRKFFDYSANVRKTRAAFPVPTFVIGNRSDRFKSRRAAAIEKRELLQKRELSFWNLSLESEILRDRSA